MPNSSIPEWALSHAEQAAPAAKAAKGHPGPFKKQFRHPETGTGAYLVRGRRLLAWSAGGYTGRIARPAGVRVHVLTPESTVAAIRAGYAPDIHPSAAAWV